MVTGTISLILITFLLLFSFFITRHLNYWKRRGVPYLKPLPLFGNMKDLMFIRMSIGQQFDYLHQKLKGHKFGGFFLVTRPCLLIRDPELIKNILVKDFECFTDISYSPDSHGDPMGSNTLSFIKGERWKFCRDKITPTFTSSTVKARFVSICNFAKLILKEVIQQRDSKEQIDIKEMIKYNPMNVMCERTFGVNGVKLLREKGLLEPAQKSSLSDFRGMFFTLFVFLLSGLTKKFGISVIEDYVKKTYAEVLRNTDIYRKGRVDLAVKLIKEYGISNINNKNNDKQKIISNCDIDISEPTLLKFLASMYLGGYETTGNALAFACYELAKNEHIQKVLRREIDDYIGECQGNITYEGVQNLSELDKVVSEVFRMYPSVNFMTRRCTKEYTIPGTNVTIEKGTHLYIPLHSIHRDSDYHPDPGKFNPDRFSEQNKIKRFTYMPFGAGPRMCIGRYLSILELKIAILYILSSFELHVCDETPMNIGIHPQGLFAASDKPVRMRVVDRKASIKPNVQTI